MQIKSLLAALGVIVLGACTKGDTSAKDSAGTRDSAAPTTATASSATTTTPAASLEDAKIAAVLDEMNVADSTFGTIASSKGTSADVKAFGVLMVNDHHALRRTVHDVVAKLGITPTPPANDSLPMKTRKIADSLNVLARGAAFDKAYIADEVANHQETLRFIDGASSATRTGELRTMLTNARPSVAMHLKRAQDIESRLGSAKAP